MPPVRTARGARRRPEGAHWLTPRLALDAAFGASRRLSRPIERGRVQPAHDIHAALGAGYALWPDRAGLGLAALAGLELARVDFDDAVGGGGTTITAESYAVIAALQVPSVDPLDSGW